MRGYRQVAPDVESRSFKTCGYLSRYTRTTKTNGGASRVKNTNVQLSPGWLSQTSISSSQFSRQDTQ